MLERQHRHQCEGFRALAYHDGVGHLRAEQQTAHSCVSGDCPHDVGYAGPAVFLEGRRGDCGLCRGGDIGDHPVENLPDEVVFVGETLVEVPHSHPGLAADAAHRQFGQVGGRTEDVQAGLQKAATPFGDSVCRLHAAVGPHSSHLLHLDTAVAPGATYLETGVLTFADWVTNGGQC